MPDSRSNRYPFEIETRLLRWGESSTAGRTVTLELSPDDSEHHPFKGLPSGAAHGIRFRMQFIPIMDDETTPEPPAQADAPARQLKDVDTPKPVDSHRSEQGRERYLMQDAMQRAVTRASILCQDAAFQHWIERRLHFVSGRIDSAETCADFLRRALGVQSRSEISSNERAYNAFLALETSYKQSQGLLAEQRS